MLFRKLPPAEQADFLRLLLDSTIEGFYSVDADGATTMCNKAFLTLLGYGSEDEVIGLKLHGIIHHTHPEGSPYDATDCPIYQAAGGAPGTYVPYELFFRTDGSSFPVEYRAEPIFKDGKPHGAICTFLDISEKLRQREDISTLRIEAEEAAERLTLALDAGTLVGTWVWDIERNHFTADERFARTFGLDAELLRRGTTLDLVVQSIHPDDLPRMQTLVADAVEGGGIYRAEYRIKGFGDSWSWVEASGRVEKDTIGRATRFPGMLIDIDQRKRVQIELERSQREYRFLFDSIDQAFAILEVLLGPDGTPNDYTFREINKAFEEQSGLIDAKDKSARAIMPGLEEHWIETYGNVALTGEAKRFVSHAEPLNRWFDVFAFRIGRPEQRRVAVLFSDVTEQRRSEAALKESEASFRRLANIAPAMSWVTDAEHRCTFLSQSWYDYTGQTEGEGLGTGWLDAVHVDDRERTGKIFLDAAGKGGAFSFEYRLRGKDGNYRWAVDAGKPLLGADGSFEGFIGNVTDIDDLKRAEAHLSLMVESAQDFAIISMEPNGQVVSWNSGAERIFGYEPHEVLGQTVDVIFTPEDRAASAPAMELSIAIREGRAGDERWHIRKNGERFYASGIMAAMKDEAGVLTGFIKIARDMTKEQHAQEALIEARNAAEAANIAKTEFLANMSHEIRTPMNAIIGLSNILSASQPLTQKQRDFIRTLQMSADSLLGLINDLLDISKIEARSVELEHIPFSVTQMMQEIISMMAVRVREKGLAFTGEGDCVENRMFMGDPTRLRQIVLNLCSNAIKFTEKGGVHVAITCEPHTTPDREMICIAVSDTGIGIAPEKRETIFHKFVQADTSINRKYGGSGLGLAITKTLAEIMGGSIRVDSVGGQGSTFTVRVPLELASDQEVATTDLALSSIAAKTIEAKVKPRILLIEDYAPNIMVAVNFLERFGYAVEVAENGLEGFEMAKSGQYFAALMDVQMHGMNGFDATKLIREHEATHGLPRLLIIGMTAHALAGDRERCLAVGMDEYISKPFNPEELRAKLLAAIEN